MTVAKLPPLFLDTSIQIARHVHSTKTKERIKERIIRHERTVTGLVARQEFKRRLLKEAEYLLRLLQRYGSYDEIFHHLLRLPEFKKNQRKRNICLQALRQVHGDNDLELTERLRLYLRSLLVQGLRRFDQSVDTVRCDTNCSCASDKVIEKQPLRKYEFGPIRCSKQKAGTCGIVNFLESRRTECQKLSAHLKSLPTDRKSAEIIQTERFLDKILMKCDLAINEDPCLTVGDLIIALESSSLTQFFTLNSIESQHLCRALDQTLIVRPLDPTKSEVVCSNDDQTWPQFGKKSQSDASDQ